MLVADVDTAMLEHVPAGLPSHRSGLTGVWDGWPVGCRWTSRGGFFSTCWATSAPPGVPGPCSRHTAGLRRGPRAWRAGDDPAPPDGARRPAPSRSCTPSTTPRRGPAAIAGCSSAPCGAVSTAMVNLRACRAATVVVTNFPALADELAERTGTSRVALHHGPQCAPGVAAADQHRGRERARPRHGFDRYCLFVGSLVDRKGPDILLRALAEVSLPCIFVGDGPMRASLERLAIRVGDRRPGGLHRSARSSRRQHYYSGAEALVLPSVSEGVPLVALEALRAGVPVVASNLTGIASVVRHGENGLLVDPGDEASLAQGAGAPRDRRGPARRGCGTARKRSSSSHGNWPDVANSSARSTSQRQRPGRCRARRSADWSIRGYALARRASRSGCRRRSPAPRAEQVTHA